MVYILQDDLMNVNANNNKKFKRKRMFLSAIFPLIFQGPFTGFPRDKTKDIFKESPLLLCILPFLFKSLESLAPLVVLCSGLRAGPEHNCPDFMDTKCLLTKISFNIRPRADNWYLGQIIQSLKYLCNFEVDFSP